MLNFFTRPETFQSTLPTASCFRDGSNVSALQNRQFISSQSFRAELHEVSIPSCCSARISATNQAWLSMTWPRNSAKDDLSIRAEALSPQNILLLAGLRKVVLTYFYIT